MSKLVDAILFRDSHVCPWWMCFTFDNIFRSLLHKPEEICSPYVRCGDHVLDIGPGMGFFSIPLARLVGADGTVTAADIQEKMLTALQTRAEKQGVADRIVTHLVSKDGLELTQEFDFALAFWMVHEVPDQRRFFENLHAVLKPSGLFLIAEPKMHVSKKMFTSMITTACSVGFVEQAHPRIALSRTLLLKR